MDDERHLVLPQRNLIYFPALAAWPGVYQDVDPKPRITGAVRTLCDNELRLTNFQLNFGVVACIGK